MGWEDGLASPSPRLLAKERWRNWPARRGGGAEGRDGTGLATHTHHPPPLPPALRCRRQDKRGAVSEAGATAKLPAGFSHPAASPLFSRAGSFPGYRPGRPQVCGGSP